MTTNRFPPPTAGGGVLDAAVGLLGRRPRQTAIALILVTALLAFEAFNFDTTKFALGDLLGHTNFMGLSWAAILAFAFCAIDFAGLVKIFTPERGGDEPREVWYLMGAWLLGATMNAIMTWYAVSLILVERQIGTEVLSREQLVQVVPIFVAALVWLTRILFIGSLSVAGEHLFHAAPQPRPSASPHPQPTAASRPPQPIRAAAQQLTAAPPAAPPRRQPPEKPRRQTNTTSRVRRRPPTPMAAANRPDTPSAMGARPRRRP